MSTDAVQNTWKCFLFRENEVLIRIVRPDYFSSFDALMTLPSFQMRSRL